MKSTDGALEGQKVTGYIGSSQSPAAPVDLNRSKGYEMQI